MAWKRFAIALLGVFLLSAGASAFGQDKAEMIVVTGQKISSDDQEARYGREMPFISIVAPAEFVLFTVSLTTATRSADERKRELEKTFAGLTTKVKGSKGVLMEVGEPGETAALDTIAVDETIQSNGDRSYIDLVLKFAVAGGESFPSVRTRAEKFIKEIQVSGRVEAITGADQYIGVNDARKHREDLLRKIAEDTRLIQTIFNGAPNGAPSVSLTGLAGRVLTRPVGPLEMEIYIPYSVVVGSAQPVR